MFIVSIKNCSQTTWCGQTKLPIIESHTHNQVIVVVILLFSAYNNTFEIIAYINAFFVINHFLLDIKINYTLLNKEVSRDKSLQGRKQSLKGNGPLKFLTVTMTKTISIFISIFAQNIVDTLYVALDMRLCAF